MYSISRRRFLAGVSAATLTTRVHATEAPIPASAGSSPTAGGLAQVNLNGLYQNFDDDYATINILKIFSEWQGDGTGDPFAMLNSDGYPTGFASGGVQWISQGTIYFIGIYSTFTATLSGTNTVTVTSSVVGSGIAIGQTVRGNGIPAGTRIIAGSGSVWTLSDAITVRSGVNCIADIPWVLDGRTGTDAFIGLTDNGQGVTLNKITISADRVEYHIEPYAGCSITGSTSGFNLTATSVIGTIAARTYGTQLHGPGIQPFTMLLDNNNVGGGVGTYQLARMLGTFKPLSYTTSGTYTLSPTPAGAGFPCTAVIRKITSTPSNMRLYRQDEEALLNVGQTASPAFKNYYGKYGRVRFLNWQAPAVSPLSQWLQRPLESNFSFGGLQTIPAVYAGIATQSISASGTNDYSCSASVSYMDSSGAALPNPSSWQDAMMVQMQFPGSTPPKQIAVTAVSHSNPCQITAPNHGLLTGAKVQFSLDGGSDNSGHLSSGLNTAGNAWHNPVYTITVIDANNFTLNGVDSTSWGTYSGSGITVYQQIRFKCGALPYKPVVGALIKGVVGDGTNGSGLAPYVKGNLFNLVYNASLDVLVAFTGHGFGPPIETMCKIANDCGFDPWIHTMFAADNNFVTQQATTIKNTLNSNLKWCVEYSNENWNGASQYGLYWSQYKFAAQFPAVTTNQTIALKNWYGLRYVQMMGLIETVYGAALSSRVTRILGYKEDDFRVYVQSAFTADLDAISFAALTSPPSSPISHADNYCYASYWGLNCDFQSQAQADQAIVTYQQGSIAGNQTTMNTALAIADTNFQNNLNAPISQNGQVALFGGGASYMATTGFSPKMCAYEGGFSQDALTLGSSGGSYLGTPYNQNDHVNFWVGYQASSLWAATWKTQIQAWKAAGGTYYSQFQGSQFEPGEGSMWAMTYPNVFGPTLPGKIMYDQYNAGLF